MNINEIESNVANLYKPFSKEKFPYDFFLAYGLPKTSISRLLNGNLNLSKIPGEICWKKKVFFKEEYVQDLHKTISNMFKTIKYDERFLIVTDYKTFLAIDTKTQEKLDIDIEQLPKHFDFFLPWAKMEKAQHHNENPADVKAAEKMAKLFDIIKNDNPDDSNEFNHQLNIFLSRLLFCFFAEDTQIFNENQFTNAIDSHTQENGSDLHIYLDNLFKVLNTPENQRENIPEYLRNFPFVNGGLFKNLSPAPKLSKKSRDILLSNGDQDWSAINPDIFGSMFQAVIDVDQRGSLGQHYTSVPNIMKVIEPLFLTELYDELEKASKNEKKLKALLDRIYNMKFFDPACGSGNFLIIAYKEIRRLEMKIFKAGDMLAFSRIRLSQFYGIEIDDFAGEVAKLALWLAEHQMNVEFFKEFGRTNPTLPLSEAGHIIRANACRVDWEKVCPKKETDEIYVFGNPPYLGSRNQQNTHKDDMDFVFYDIKKHRDLDYISIWFYKAAKYIKNFNIKSAFVSTNSICQGLQVGLFWPYIFDMKIEINFAYTSFRWVNNAKHNAGVTVVIIGLHNKSNENKIIFSNTNYRYVKNINGYLLNGKNIQIERRMKPLSNFKKMSFGNMPADGGNLILTKKEKEEIESKYPNAKIIIKRLVGSKEFIRDEKRYCLWIKNEAQYIDLKSYEINDRISRVAEVRSKSARPHLAKTPYLFAQITAEPCDAQIIIPAVSSERRQYLPIGFLSSNTVISNSAMVISNPKHSLFAILNSKMHMIWLKSVGGRLKTDFRYSKDIVYNTFPFPKISKKLDIQFSEKTFQIIEEREKHPEKTLAELYDPDKMPKGLKKAHEENDLLIEKCYRNKPFSSDEERLEHLFNLYEKMIEEEKVSG